MDWRRAEPEAQRPAGSGGSQPGDNHIINLNRYEGYERGTISGDWLLIRYGKMSRE